MVTRFGFQDTMAACGYTDGFLRIFNLSTENKISLINTNPSTGTVPINCLRWRPQNQSTNSMSSVLLAAGANGNLFQYAAKTGKLLFQTKQQDNFILCMDYSHDGRVFATAGKDNTIRIYDQESKKVSQKLKGINWQTSGHNNRLFSLKFKDDEPDLIVSGGWDLNVHVWDRRTGEVVSTMYGPKIAGDALDIRGDHILTGANRGSDQLQLWDWRQKKIVNTFVWNAESNQSSASLFCAQFSKHSPNTVVACGGTQMKMFSTENFQEIWSAQFDQKDSLYTCDSSYGGNKYLVGGKAGALYYLGSNKTFEQ